MAVFDTAAMVYWRVAPLDFIKSCLIDPETNQPFVLSDAERFFLRLAFQRDEKGRLKHPELIFGAIRKSGKSTLAAIFIITLLLLYGGRHADAYICANTFEQAQSRVFTMCCRIVEASPALKREAKITKDRIVFKHFYDATIFAIASNAAGAAGSNATVISFDELSGATTEAAVRFFQEMTVSPARQISCRLITTFAGYSGESVLLENIYRRGMALPLVGPSLHAGDGMLFAWHCLPTQPWQDDEWIEQQRQTLRPAQFRRQILNEWVYGNESFLNDMAKWNAIEDPNLGHAISDRNLSVWVGVDASVTRDSTGLCAVTFDQATQKIRLCAHKIFQPSPDAPLNFEATIEATLLDWHKRFNIRKILFDPNQMQSSAQRLRRAGLRIEEFSQTPANLTTASAGLYELISTRGLMVYVDDVLRLAISRSVAVETQRGWRLDKSKASDKIDIVIALAMAVHACTQGQGESQYDVSGGQYPDRDDPNAAAIDADPLKAANAAWQAARYFEYLNVAGGNPNFPVQMPNGRWR